MLWDAVGGMRGWEGNSDTGYIKTDYVDKELFVVSAATVQVQDYKQLGICRWGSRRGTYSACRPSRIPT